jgi:hypothetical protein
MLVVVASAKGAPGVSTVCVGLAATWPPGWRPVLVEVDRSGGDLAAWHGVAAEPGLVSLAAASRHTGRPDLVWDHVQELPGGLQVVPAPAGAEQASAALEVLLGSTDLGFLTDPTNRPGHTPDIEPGRVVVVADVGRLPARISPGSGVGRLLAGADVVLLVAGSDVAGVVHAAAAIDTLAGPPDRSGGRAGRVRLLLAGRGGYRAEEVADALGVPVECQLPEDPRTAAALAGRPSRRAVNVTRSPLLRTFAGLAQNLVRDRHVTSGSGPATGPPPTLDGRAGRAAGTTAPPRAGGREPSAPGADLSNVAGGGR